MTFSAHSSGLGSDSLSDTGHTAHSVTDTAPLSLASWRQYTSSDTAQTGFNPISTVLSHPTKRQDPLRPSRKPLRPLQPVQDIPKPPPPAHYNAYLSSVTPLYQAWQVRGDVPDQDGAAPQEQLPPLDTIPAIFFDKAFDLASPSTWSTLVPPDDNAHLQDTFSTHLDTLERHLLHEITLRTTSFFSALSNLQDLHSESTSCLSHIASLKTALADVSKTQAATGLEIVQRQERLATLKTVRTGVDAIAELDEISTVAERLVVEGDWQGGLGCVESLIEWSARYNDSVPPVATLSSLSALPSRTAHLLETIASHLTSTLNAYLASLLARPVDQPPTDVDVRSTLTQMLEGFIKCGKLDLVYGIWNEVVVDAVREESRRCLPASDDDDQHPETRGANLAHSLQAMDHTSFMDLCTRMYSAILGRLSMVQQIGTVMETAITTCHLSPLSMTTPTDPPPRTSFSPILSSSSDLAHTRTSKILSVRTDQHASLPLASFLQLYNATSAFITSTETVAERPITALRGVLGAQARAFVARYHAERLTASAKAVEEEIWAQVDVQHRVQTAVDLVVQAATADPDAYLVSPDPGVADPGAGDQGAAGKQLKIRDTSYFVVKATAETLLLLGDYLKVVINLQGVVPDIMPRIIEFLKSFNSRTCQVVLGAGAMRSAGLKNITAKHLALASQSLSIIIALVPSVREFIRRKLGGVGAGAGKGREMMLLGEFDKLERDYQDHQNEIHAKLVAIMSDRLAVHCASLREIKWDSPGPTPNPYAELLVKESATLHKVLFKYLSPSTVESVMTRVVCAIVERLSEEYGRVHVGSEDVRMRMMQDVALISVRLRPLSKDGKEEVKRLEEVVMGKKVPRGLDAESENVGLVSKEEGVKTEEAKTEEAKTEDFATNEQDQDQEKEGSSSDQDKNNVQDKERDTDTDKEAVMPNGTEVPSLSSVSSVPPAGPPPPTEATESAELAEPTSPSTDFPAPLPPSPTVENSSSFVSVAEAEETVERPSDKDLDRELDGAGVNEDGADKEGEDEEEAKKEKNEKKDNEEKEEEQEEEKEEKNAEENVEERETPPALPDKN